MADYLILEQLMLAGDIDSTTEACLKLLEEPPKRSTDLTQLKATCELILQNSWPIGQPYSRETNIAARIVAIAFLPISKLDRLQPSFPTGGEDLVIEILSLRPREFRDAWVGITIRYSIHSARIVHRLIADGLATEPEGDMLLLALMSNPRPFDLSEPGPSLHRKSTADVLRDNLDLLKGYIWRLFEVEGRTDAHCHLHARFFTDWAETFIELAADQTLERERVLGSSLVALSRGFSAHHSAGFIQLHDGLKPSPDESEGHSNDYLRLCASEAGTIVKFALRSLEKLQRDRPLNPDQVLSEIGPALLSPAKSTAGLAIKILVASVGDNSDLFLPGALALLPALSHPKPDIQLDAVRRMQAWFSVPPKTLKSQLEPILQSCHITTQALLKPWLSSEANPTRPSRPIAFPPTRPRKTAFAEVLWLHPDRTLPSPQDDDELLELASTTLEQPRDADQIESLVAALAACDRPRLRKQPSAITIARRAQTLLDRYLPSGQVFVASCLVASFIPNDFIRPLLSHWETNSLINSKEQGVPLGYLLFHRFAELAQRLHTGESFTPLATPTHLGGLIDPVVFADRIINSPTASDSMELHCALLLLAPSPKQLDEASRILAQSGPVYGLPTKWIEGWFDYCSEFRTHSVDWYADIHENAGGYQSFRLRLNKPAFIQPPGTAQIATLPKTWQPHTRDHASVSLCTSLTPGLPALVAEFGIVETGGTYTPGHNQQDTTGVLDPFFDEAVPTDDAAHLLLALSLNKPTPIARATAIDLAIVLSEDNRLDPVLLGTHIGALCGTTAVVPSRYAAALSEVAGAMSEPYAMVEVLESVIATTNSEQARQILGMLELLESLIVELCCGLRPSALSALTCLSQASKTSKTAKTAGRILLLVEA